jgi:hypothetical protein
MRTYQYGNDGSIRANKTGATCDVQVREEKPHTLTGKELELTILPTRPIVMRYFPGTLSKRKPGIRLNTTPEKITGMNLRAACGDQSLKNERQSGSVPMQTKTNSLATGESLR